MTAPSHHARKPKGPRLAALILTAIGIALLVLVLLPQRCHHYDGAAQTANNGRNIYFILKEALIACDAQGVPSAWPPSSGIRSSTEYISSQSNGVFRDILPSFFSAAEIGAAADWTRFNSSNNIWCLNPIPLRDATSPGANLPLLFARNVHFRTKNGHITPYLSDDPPFRKRRTVTVTASGTAKVVPREALGTEFGDLTEEDIAHILRPEQQ